MKKLFLLTLCAVAISQGTQAVDQSNSHSSAVEITSENFEQFSSAKKPFVLDVWAEWCPPCKMMKPIFDQAAKNNSEYVFGSCDFEKDQNLVQKLKVTSLPSFIVIKDNKEYGRIVGAVESEKVFLEKIKECLANEAPTAIGHASKSPQEIMMQLGQLLQKASQDEQVAGLKKLFEEGLTTDMVLMEIPAMGDRPAYKATIATLLLGTNKALFQVLIDQGVDAVQVNTEIDSILTQLDAVFEKMDLLEKMVKGYASKNASKNSVVASAVTLSSQECLIRFSMLLQKPAKDQVEGLRKLLKEGLAPDMVLMEVPAIGDRAACKLTPITMVVGTQNKELLQLLLDSGANIDKVNAEIELKNKEINLSREKINEFKRMLQVSATNEKSSKS